jgi:hypothetical protein
LQQHIAVQNELGWERAPKLPRKDDGGSRVYQPWAPEMALWSPTFKHAAVVVAHVVAAAAAAAAAMQLNKFSHGLAKRGSLYFRDS